MDLNEFMKKQNIPVPKAKAKADKAKPPNKEEAIPQGRRNSTMSHIAGKLIKRYGNTDRARKIFDEKATACDPPLPDAELNTIWSSAVKFGETVSAQEGYIPPEDYNNPIPRKPGDYSDLGQAYVFADFCGDYVRYSPATDYIVYDGICWQESKSRAQAALDAFTDDQLKEAEEHVERTAEYMEQTGANEVIAEYGKKSEEHMTEEQLKAYRAHGRAKNYRAFVIKHRDSKYLTATLKEARPMVEIDHSELDKNPFLLNTPDYTIDLRKGQNGILPHQPEDFITKCTTLSPSTKGADIWEKALDVFFCGDEELKRYVQMITGLCAIGHVYIEAMIIAYGEGRNGKSTFWNSIARVLGSYSGNISADALTVGCKRNVKPELAETNGVRMLLAAEMEEGLRFNTSIVKQLTSTDKIFAEKKYKSPFSFTPSHTLVLYTNHLPKVGANDPGTWRRLIVVPFNAKIEGSGDRKNYADYLYHHAGGAILAWIVEGAKAVIDAGFHIEQPECVKVATGAYRESSDWLGNFIDECCVVGDNCHAPSGELYTRYRSYCQQSGEYTRSTTDFYSALEFAGYTKRRTKKGRFICGLGIRSEFEPPISPLV